MVNYVLTLSKLRYLQDRKPKAKREIHIENKGPFFDMVRGIFRKQLTAGSR